MVALLPARSWPCPVSNGRPAVWTVSSALSARFARELTQTVAPALGPEKVFGGLLTRETGQFSMGPAIPPAVGTGARRRGAWGSSMSRCGGRSLPAPLVCAGDGSGGRCRFKSSGARRLPRRAVADRLGGRSNFSVLRPCGYVPTSSAAAPSWAISAGQRLVRIHAGS